MRTVFRFLWLAKAQTMLARYVLCSVSVLACVFCVYAHVLTACFVCVLCLSVQRFKDDDSPVAEDHIIISRFAQPAECNTCDDR